MQFLTGKDYPHLCEGCRATITEVAQALAETGPDTDDNEAPIMYVGDHAMFCGGARGCLDSEYKFRGVRQILDSLQARESTATTLRLGHDHNPDRGLSDVADLVRQLKAEFQIEDEAPEPPAGDEVPIPVSLSPVATYEIITAWLDNLLAFQKIVEVEDGAIRRADVDELNATLIAELRQRNPDLEIEEV